MNSLRCGAGAQGLAMTRLPSHFARPICAPRTNKRRSRRPRLVVLSLEDRTTPTTFPVTDPGDSGPGKLRQAIDDANAAAGADKIVFDPTVFATPQTVSLNSALSNINESVTITGTSAANVTVTRASGAGSYFAIFTTNDSAEDVIFDGITITGGTAGGITAGHRNLTVRNTVISGNTGGVGGG